MNLAQRGKLKKRLDDHENGERLVLNDLKFRHGLAPGGKNIVNVRHKIEPHVDPQKVMEVEEILKSLIETGFAGNCDEELLEFDENGKIKNVVEGLTSQRGFLNHI